MRPQEKRDNNNAIRISQDDITRVYADSAAGYRYVHFARTLFVRAARCCACAVYREIPLADLVDVTDRSVKNNCLKMKVC